MALNPHPLVRAGVGFACAGGSASHGQWPQQASFRSVVVGILGNGHQLDRIYSTWLPELWQGHVYLMVDACEHATTSLSMHRRNAKTRAARDGPVIQLVRHHTPTILARSKTQANQMPPASRFCRTASRRRGTASQSARPSPLRARAGCGCRGSTEQTRFGSRPPLSSRACGMPSRDDAGTSRPTRTRFCCRARSRDSSRRARRRCRRNGPRTSVTWRARRRLGLLPYPKILTLTLTR